MTPRSLSMRFKLPAALCAGLLLSTPILASAQDAPPPPPPGDFGPGGGGGPGGPGRRGGPDGSHGGPFMQELRTLNLSETQRQTIRADVEATREQRRAEFETMRTLHRTFDTAAPGSAGYNTVVVQLADAEAKAARTRVQAQADLRAKVYALLTDAQKARLASDLANLPEPPAPPL